MRPAWLVPVALVALSASCTSVAPVAIHNGDQCYRCKRIISDTRFGSELLDGTLASKFRAPGCMAKYIADHAGESGKLFVTDYETEKLIPAETALFVPVVMNRDTGERDYRAYGMRAAAQAAAHYLGTEVVTWQTVVAKARS